MSMESRVKTLFEKKSLDPQKRVEIEQFIASLDQEFTPVVPDEVVDFFLKRSGFNSPDVRMIRLIALAAEKFIADISYEVLQKQKMKAKKKDPLIKTKISMTTEDLLPVLEEYGLTIRKPEYFTNSMTAGLTNK